MSFKRINWTEPAVLRGVITAIIALLASIGVVVSNDVTGAAEGLIPVAAVLIPLAQSLWTRAAVFSPKTFQETVGKHAAGLSNGPAV
jgi:hypothetical protein